MKSFLRKISRGSNKSSGSANENPSPKSQNADEIVEQEQEQPPPQIKVKPPPPPKSPPPPPPPPLPADIEDDLNNANPDQSKKMSISSVSDLSKSSESSDGGLASDSSSSYSDEELVDYTSDLGGDPTPSTAVTKIPDTKADNSDSSSGGSSDYGSDVDNFLEANDSGVEDFLASPSIEQKEKKPEEYVKSNFDVLCNVRFFAQFTEDHQKQLFAQLKVQKFKDGDLIVEQGTIGDRMYVIIEGEVSVWKQLPDGTTEDITHIYTHDFFGELALVYGKERVANVSAVGSTTVMYLTKKSFEQFEEIRMFLIVSKVPLLKNLSKETQLEVVRLLEPVAYEAGDEIVRQGEIGDAFYMITKGVAEVVENGERTVRLYDGHTFGQMALLSDRPRLATVRATEPLTALRLSAVNFKELLKDSGNLKSLLMQDDRNIRRRRSKREERRKSSKVSTLEQRRHSVHAAYNFASQVPATKEKPALIPAKSFYVGKGSNNNNNSGTFSVSKPLQLPMKLKKQHGSASSMVEERNKIKKTTRHGKKVINGFVLLERIGAGTFGTVRKCQDEKTKEIFAIKIVDRSRFKKGKDLKSKYIPSMEDMRKEVAIMKKLSHPNVVNLVAVIDDPTHDNLYLVTEYCAKGAIMSDLSDKIEPYSEATARKYFRDVLSGLDYLHYQNVIHRDIKPMNLLITEEDVVKIADFGAARMVMGDQKWIAGVAGTPAFMAPELLVEDKSVYDGPAVDLWSCGATLFMMVTGQPPWMSDDELQLARKVKNDELIFPDDWDEKGYSPYLRNLIKELLVKDPNKRLSLYDTMTHDWVTEEDTDILPVTYANLERPSSSGNVRKHLTTEDQDGAIEPMNQFVKKDSSLTANSSQYSHIAGSITTSSATRRSSNPNSSFMQNHGSNMAFPSANTLHRAQMQNLRSGNRARASTFHLDLGDDISYVEHQNIDSDDDMSQSEYSTLPGDDIGRIESFHKDSDDMLRVRVRHNAPLPTFAEGVDEIDYSSDSESDDCDNEIQLLSKNIDLFTNKDTRTDANIANASMAIGSIKDMKDQTQKEEGLDVSLTDPRFRPLDSSVSITAKKGTKVSWCGIRYGMWSEQGQKQTQEDTTCTVHQLFRKGKTTSDITNVFFSALYDGHGGEIVSEYLAENFHKAIVERSTFPENLPKAMKNACLALDRKYIHKAASAILEHNRKVNAGEVRQGLLRTKADKRGTASTIEQYRKAGSTAVFVLISKQAVSSKVTLDRLKGLYTKSNTDKEDVIKDINAQGTTGVQDNLRRILHVGWVGDSRAVLCTGGRALQLSEDHKARNESEKQRIRDAGGTVDRSGRLNGVLAVSRAFGGLSHKGEDLNSIVCLGSEGSDSGDEALAKGALTAAPGIASRTLTQDDEFIVLASDGLFDSMDNQAVVNFVRRQLYETKSAKKAAENLVSTAMKSCGAVDNTTAVVIVLRT